MAVKNSNNRKLLDKGYTANVFLVPGTRRVCKSFLPSCAGTHFPAEVEAYKRFTAAGRPSTILTYHGVDEEDPAGIILDLAENGNLYRYLEISINGLPSQDTLYRWARQAAEGLAFAHSCGVLHSDIHCVNFLLDENLDLKVADFAGASIDGSISWSFYRITHQLPRAEGHDDESMEITTASEIFALGSALYYMVEGHDIYPELDYHRDQTEIVKRLREKRFPDTSELAVLGPVITKCWNLEYASMEDVIAGIVDENRSVAINVIV